MTDKIELTAILTGCNKLWYQFQSKQVPENVFTVPVVVMNYCDYPPEILDENGYIKISSKIHKGSTFSLFLPKTDPNLSKL